MAYGDDITEGIPYNLSNPVGNTAYSGTAESYDIAIGTQPFFMAISDETPYRRQTAQYRKQQIDQSTEPGEQSITGWWVRAQSSFHNGEGIKFFDPSAGELVSYRFADSKGVDVWTKGQTTLLKSCTSGHVMTGAIASNGTVQQHARSIKWSTFTGALVHDEYDVDKIKVTDPSNPIHFIDYNSGTDSPVYAICDDGTYAYWITNTSTKKTVYKKALTLTSSDANTKMFDEIGTISNATMEYVKDRIVLCADNKVYEFATSATAIPSPVYTNPTSTHVYTSVAASGPAIYIAGYNGSQSTIQKFTLNTAGAMPTLTSAITAAEMPTGEIIHKIFYYLGYMMIGTNKGIRAALVSDQDGSINYGPLIVETSQPCYDFAARDKFVWCATSVGGEPGLIRIDLGSEIETLRFAYANDVYYPGVTGHVTTAVCFDGNTDPTTTDRLMFTTAYAASTNGAVYVESASTLMSSGYVTTGKIRYGTLENKVFKNLKARINNTYGALTMESIDNADSAYVIGNFAEGDFTPEVNVSYPAGPQEYLSFRFTLKRFSTDSTKGPTFNGYQLKSLPAIPRQRLISYPLACYDHETDSLGVQVGHEGAAYEKLLILEATENAGDTIRVEDFRTGESFLGLIEEMQFINRTPSDKRFSGFGGVLLLTIRTI
jgi:hypothetical protein